MLCRYAILFALCLNVRGAITPWGQPLPKRTKPPVLFVTGHDPICPDPVAGEISSFNFTFRRFDEVMERTGRISLHLNVCDAPGRPRIEEIGNVLRRRLEALVYEDGTPVREIDVVAHSMGGLVVRAYLSGKQTAGGVFTPPPNPPIRKIVFIATPHFGTPVASIFDLDPQIGEISLGSRFLFELATWNQGTDDLRGAEAIALTGTAGVTTPESFTDGVVSLTSASIDWIAEGRTRVLPMCHTFGGIGALFLCKSGSRGIANVDDEQHPTAKAVLSFFEGTDEWKTVGSSESLDPYLSRYTGLFLQLRSADDREQPITSATAANGSATPNALTISREQLAYSERISAGPATLQTRAGVSQNITLPAGGTRPLVEKAGPRIVRVRPSAGTVSPLAVAPGMAVEIHGEALEGGAVTVTAPGGSETPLLPMFASGSQINVVMPERVQGLARLRVQSTAGSHAVNIMVEPVLPALVTSGPQRFAAAVNAVTGALITPERPAISGDILSVFLSGLGETFTRQGLEFAVQAPEVTIAGQSCAVLYAGRAPGLPGVDQINCRVPDLVSSGSVPIVVSSDRRSSVAALPVLKR